MTRQNLEFYLNRGDALGFTKSTDSDEFIGWISLVKKKPIPRFDEIVSKDQEPELFEEQLLIKLKPFIVEVCELNRTAYEDDNNLPERSDYRLAEVYHFENLEEVSEFLRSFEINLCDAKWLSEIPSF